MFGRKKNQTKSSNFTSEVKQKHSSSPWADIPVTEDYDKNVNNIRKICAGCGDIVEREIRMEGLGGLRVHLFFIIQMVNLDYINGNIILPMVAFKKENCKDNVLDIIQERVLTVFQVSREKKILNAVYEILKGSAILIIEGENEILALNLQNRKKRSIEEPSVEKTIRGPREGFIEDIFVNMSLVRTRLPIPELKFEMMEIGHRTRTRVTVAYVEGIAKVEILNEIKKRLSGVNVDMVIDTQDLTEYITDSAYSPIVQTEFTERPDKTVGSLVEGRFAILVDGTATIILTPTTVWDFIQASDDYHTNFYYASFTRMLRVATILITLFFPAIYVSIITFHQGVVPTELLISIAMQREGIPFPAAVEAVLMILTFELLREAGARLPIQIGQAVSIVGAIVIGESAVMAGIVSPAMVIVVAITGIASFTIPAYNFTLTLRLMSFVLLFLGSFLGLFGVMIGGMILLTHTASLKSFGIPFLTPAAPLFSLKDIFVRAPWTMMNKRSRYLAQDKTRQKT